MNVQTVSLPAFGSRAEACRHPVIAVALLCNQIPVGSVTAIAIDKGP